MKDPHKGGDLFIAEPSQLGFKYASMQKDESQHLMNETPGRSLGELEKELEGLKRENELLRLERDRYKLCFEKAPSGILLETADGTIIDVNPACCSSLGWASEDLIGNKIHMLAHEEIRWKVEENLQRIMSGEVLRHTVRSEHKDGKVVYSVLNESKIPLNDHEEGIIIISLDVTELKAKEQELFKSELRIRAILQAIPDMLFMMNKEGEFLEVHQGEFDLLVPAEQLIGMNHRDVGLPVELIEKSEAAIHEAIEKNHLVSYEYQLVKKGEVQFFETRLVPIQETEVIGIVREITQQKQTQDRLESALLAAEEAAKAKTAFLANMSHEMRTPLNGIVGMADLLAHSDLELSVRESISIIQESSHILLELINNVLDFSRIEAGKVELEEIVFRPDAMMSSVKSICGLHAKEKGIPIELNLDADVPEFLIGDLGRIRQILLNLTSNAVKFTESGSVQLSASVEFLEKGLALVCFSVKDSGIGISQAAVENIFNPFIQEELSTTRKYGGSGLGLAICRSLVELMKGTIEVTTQQGKGSTFRAKIPLKVAKSDPSKTTKTTETALTVTEVEDLCVLLVEDNPVNQKVLFKILQSLGIEQITISVNGLEALNECKREVYDFIFMDCQMPVMDGYEATRLIRSESLNKDTPIIALTANAFKTTAEECFRSGMNAFLTKPINKQALIKAINERQTNQHNYVI